jgi:hypothetical protein
MWTDTDTGVDNNGNTGVNTYRKSGKKIYQHSNNIIPPIDYASDMHALVGYISNIPTDECYNYISPVNDPLPKIGISEIIGYVPNTPIQIGYKDIPIVAEYKPNISVNSFTSNPAAIYHTSDCTLLQGCNSERYIFHNPRDYICQFPQHFLV